MNEELTSDPTPSTEISVPMISLSSGEEGKKVESEEGEDGTIFEDDAAEMNLSSKPLSKEEIVSKVPQKIVSDIPFLESQTGVFSEITFGGAYLRLITAGRLDEPVRGILIKIIERLRETKAFKGKMCYAVVE